MQHRNIFESFQSIKRAKKNAEMTKDRFFNLLEIYGCSILGKVSLSFENVHWYSDLIFLLATENGYFLVNNILLKESTNNAKRKLHILKKKCPLMAYIKFSYICLKIFGFIYDSYRAIDCIVIPEFSLPIFYR